MNTKTQKSWQQYLVTLLLVTAFLAVPWINVHIHLAEQHFHDSAKHQHQVNTHAHSLTEQYTAAVDFSDRASHTNVVEFDPGYNLSERKTQEPSATALFNQLSPPVPSFSLTSIQIPVIPNSKLSYLSYSTTNPRAPPPIS